MNPTSFDAIMYGMLAKAMERDKQAHRASIDELAKLCPRVKKRLQVLHQEYCQRLDQELAKARRLMDSPFVDDEGCVDDPAWQLLVYLTRDQPPGDQNMDGRLHLTIRRSFGQPVPLNDPEKD